MRLSEIAPESTGWTTVRPKITRALSAISKKIGAEFAPNKSGFVIYNDLGKAKDLGWEMGGWLGVNMYGRVSQNGAYGKNRIHASVSVLVSGETVRMTSDGGIEGERNVPVWQMELEPDASAEDILAMFEQFKEQVPKAIEVMNAEIDKLKAGPQA